MYNVQLIHSFHCFEFIELTLFMLVLHKYRFLSNCLYFYFFWNVAVKGPNFSVIVFLSKFQF